MLLEDTPQLRANRQSLPRVGQFCPECGQLLNLFGRPRTLDANSRSWWSWILAALGLYVAVTFAVEARIAHQLATVIQDDLHQAAPRCLSSSGVGPGCQRNAQSNAPDPVMAHLARYYDAEQKALRDLAITVVGLLAALSGIGTVAQHLCQVPEGSHPSLLDRLLRLAFGIAGVGERTFLPCAQVLLAASCSVAVFRLFHGAPPSWDLVAESIPRIIELVVAVAENAVLGGIMNT